MNTHMIYVDGAWQTATGGNPPLDVVNPATEAVIATVPDCSEADVLAAVAAARAAQPDWAALPVAERAALLREVARRLRESESDLVDLAVSDIGCNRGVAKAMSVIVPAFTFENVAANIEKLEWERVDGDLRVHRVPVGVVAAITPWNYPLHQIAAKVAAALGTGNTVVLKPSEVAPLTAWKLTAIIDEVGFPKGVFNLVSGTGAGAGETLVRADVDMVTFTGSVATGERIGEICGAQVKRVALELGGKSAGIVTDDADLGRAVGDAVAALASNSGQTCSALTRILVPRDRLAEAEEIAVRTAEQIVIGDPAEPTVQMGPVVSRAQLEKVQGYVDAGRSSGAKELTISSPSAMDGRGYFVPFTVFSDVDNSMKIAQDEIFGPVLCLIPFDSIPEAIRIANDTRYGLAAAVWAGSDEAALTIATQLEAGQVKVNGGKFNPAAPFGGMKKSGVGRELGEAGLEEFLEYQAILL